MKILGIESSCDETAAAVVEDGRTVLSSVIASQVDIHHRWGGVVPELASRKHIEAIGPVVLEALDTAGIRRGDVEAVAVTQGPGLVGSLLVGFSFAKAFAYGLGIPWVGVDHLEGHIQSLFLSGDPPVFPFVALLASGGHTSIYHVSGPTRMAPMGRTRDDAAGEAYDKVAKILGLGYPGGEPIDRLAAQGDPDRVRFKRPFLDRERFDFSFSGIKSAVNRFVQEHADDLDSLTPHIAAGFQEAVVDVLSFKLVQAAESRRCRHLAVAGGVAANRRLREIVRERAEAKGMAVHIPPAALCGDNAAMIAAAGYHRLKSGARGGLTDDVYSRSAMPAG
ncbi:MAG: tRNA (adenosine(37)-N6)-threonylcarbamoyltransferase complex transferase subunit TsaD [Desulfobacterales bacterium]